MISITEFVKTLKEHALKRKKVMQKIDSLQFPIAKHLIKIAIFPNSQETRHWQKEVLNWFIDIDMMDVKGQARLKEKQYFELLYKEPLTPLNVIERTVKNLIKFYKDLRPCVKNIKEKSIKIDENARNLIKNLSKDYANNTFDADKYERLIENYRNIFLEDCND